MPNLDKYPWAPLELLTRGLQYVVSYYKEVRLNDSISFNLRYVEV